MKRLLISAGLALLIHSLFLSAKADWMTGRSVQKESPETISLSIDYLIPVLPEETEEKIPEPLIKKNPPEIEKEILEKIIPEPEKKIDPVPKEQVRAPVIKKQVASDMTGEKPALTETSDKGGGEISPKEKSEPEYVSRYREETHVMERTEPADIKPEAFLQDTIPLREAVPVYKDNPEPIYPKRARRRGLEGSVVLDVFVGSEGIVEEIRLSKSSGHSILDRAAIEAVEKWVFTPGMKGDEAVDMWVKIPVRFRLE